MSALVYWELSKSPQCLGAGRRSKARAINICSLLAKAFPCKPHQSLKIPWHAIFSFLLLILEAVTVTDSGKCSANTPLNRKSFHLPFNFIYFFLIFIFIPSLPFQYQFFNPGGGSFVSSLTKSLTIWFSHYCVLHNSCLILLWKQISIWGLGAEN